LDAVGPEAAEHREIHRVGDPETPEQERPARARETVAEQLEDAVDLVSRVCARLEGGHAPEKMRGQLAADRAKAADQLAADRPRSRAIQPILRPEARSKQRCQEASVSAVAEDPIGAERAVMFEALYPS